MELLSGQSKEFYFYVEIARVAAARDRSRNYYAQASATGFTTVTTPRPRDLFVQRLIRHNRNQATGLFGPDTVLVGREYIWRADYSTQSFSVIQGHITWANPLIQTQAVYGTAGLDVLNSYWIDTCNWDEVLRTCTTIATKAGGDIQIFARAFIAGEGNTTAQTLIYDISGASWHYNTDWQDAINSISATSVDASIGGNIFADRNINAQWDQPLLNPEPTLGSVLVSLYSGTGPTRTLVTTTNTTAYGVYYFDGLGAGTYEVEVDESTVPVSHVLTTGSNPEVITIANANDTNNLVDFGYVDPVHYVSMEEMSASTAGPGASAIVAWTTGEEIDNAGFHVWRAVWNATEGQWLPSSRLTSTLIASEASFSGGASYTFADPVPVQQGETRRVYYVVDIDFAGVSTFHGPIILEIVSDFRSGVDEWMSY